MYAVAILYMLSRGQLLLAAPPHAPLSTHDLERLAVSNPKGYLAMLHAMVRVGYDSGLLPGKAHFDTHDQVTFPRRP